MNKSSSVFLLLLVVVSFGNWGCNPTVVPPSTPKSPDDLLFVSRDNGVTWTDKARLAPKDLPEKITDIEFMPDGITSVFAGKSSAAPIDIVCYKNFDFAKSERLLVAFYESMFGIEGKMPNQLLISDISKIHHTGADLFSDAIVGNSYSLPEMGEITFLEFLPTNDSFGLCAQSNPANARSVGYTSDSGRTWSYTEFDRKIYNVLLVNESNYLIASEEGIYHSTDHGKNWDAVQYLKLSAMDFNADGSVGFGIGKDELSLFKTTSPDADWQRMDQPEPPSGVGAINSLAVASAGNGVWVVLERDVLYNNTSHSVLGYKYYIRRIKDDGTTVGTRSLLVDKTDGKYDFSFIRVNRNNPNEICVVLR